MLRPLLRSQVWLSHWLDSLLPGDYRVDGYMDFAHSFAPRFLRRGMKIYDIGGGKRPFLSPAAKRELGAIVVGIDISAPELALAPPGSYDQAIAADIAAYSGPADGDAAVCLAVLEHVRDVGAGIRGIASVLAEGGVALVFVPCRNAVFARLNLMLPERAKRAILFALYPQSREGQGFPSFYDRCTPADFARLAGEHGLEVVERRIYFQSAYFTFFFPLHVLWRLWVFVFRLARGPQAAETFCVALRKRPAPRAAHSGS